MAYWQFKTCELEDVNQPWEWLNRQHENVVYQIWAHVVATSNIQDAPTEEFDHLSGKYEGLSQLLIPFGEPIGMQQVALIGFLEPDSRNFIVVRCVEVADHSYGLALDKALDCKRNWAQKLGDVYDLFPDDNAI